MVHLWIKASLRVLSSMLIVVLVTAIAYGCHAKSFVAGFLYLFPVMLIAFRWGFFEASIASIAAVACLDYFFTAPLFHFYMSDPQDWVALVSFEAVVLVFSRLADRLKQHAIEAEKRREQIERLYLLTRDILLLDRRDRIGTRLVNLIAGIFHLNGVSLWDASEARLDKVGCECIPEDEIRAAYFHRQHHDDAASRKYKRALFVGVRPMGAIGLSSSSVSSTPIDARTADAIASLAALALERSYSFKAESSAEAAHQSEQFRSTVLDSLAHAFKTPLSTIQAASSGLLEMNPLRTSQKELVTLINGEAVRLGHLATEMLQTARLDENHLSVQRSSVCLDSFLRTLLEQSAQSAVGDRLRLLNETPTGYLWADSRLLQMALLELINNAEKYADPSSQITVNVTVSDTELTFRVHNHGSYLAPEERPKIFRRFYRSPGYQYRAPGTGIGLSFVKRIADLHEGHVWVDSDTDSGTSFFFTLPLASQGNENG